MVILDTSTFDIVQMVADGQSEAIDVINAFEKPFNTMMNSALLKGVFNSACSIGTVLMLIYFFIDLEDIALRQNFNVEVFVRNLVKLVVGLAVILNVGPLLSWFNDFGIAVLEEIVSSKGALNMSPTFNDAKASANYMLEGSSIFEAPIHGIMVLIVYIFKFFAFFVVWMVAIKRALEFSIYYAFSPIIFADVFSNGLTGVVQKMKPIIAIYLQLPYVMILMSLGNVLVDGSVAVVTTFSSILLTWVVLKSTLSAVSHSKDELDRFLSS